MALGGNDTFPRHVMSTWSHLRTGTVLDVLDAPTAELVISVVISVAHDVIISDL